jgi:eukaryotic-like serine/threonine-protein kinase
MGTCPRCATATDPGATFCAACGASLAAVAVAGAGTGAVPVVAASGSGESLVGAMVGEYQVTTLIGEGGMGTVYGGIQPLIGKKVAIKVLRGELSRDPDVMVRFLAEARAVNRIGHPNIVDVFSFGAFPDGTQFFVMEHLQGRSLAAHLEQVKRLGYAEACAIVGQVCDALEAAHQRDIVHRDLKPDNIFLVDRQGGGFIVKLLDFGIAKFTADKAMTGHTRTGVPIGTPLYMSPEHCRGRDVGPWSDIYSLGVILYEMFAGVPPFTHESFYEVISAHLTAPPPPLHTRCSVPADLEAVVHKCLEKERAKRYASVAELRAALMPLLEELALQQTGPIAVRGTAARSRIEAPPPAARSRTGLVAALVAVAVLAIGGTVAVLAWPRRAPAPTPVAAPPVAPPASTPAAAPVDAGAPRLVMIQLMITPPGVAAEVFVDGKKQEKTAFEVPMSTSRSFELAVRAPGFEPYVQHPIPVASAMIAVPLVKAGEPARAGGRRPGPAPGKAGAGAPTPEKAAPPPTKSGRIDKIDGL